MRALGVGELKKERNVTQNNNGNSQVRRTLDWRRTKIFDLDHAAQADLVWSALVYFTSTFNSCGIFSTFPMMFSNCVT